MNKKELVAKVAGRAGLSRSAAAGAVDALFSVDDGILAEELSATGRVHIQAFGTFNVSRREARIVRMPWGLDAQVPARSYVSFRASRTLHRYLNAEEEG